MKKLIIDGYNLMFQADPYARLAREGEWDLARDALISDIASYAGQQFEATIVFDGKNNPVSERKESTMLGVRIIFSDYGKSADSVIERLAKQAVNERAEVELVSSDALIQWTALGKGVVRRSAAEFAQQLSFGYSEWERERDAPPKRSTLSSRVDSQGAEILRRIRDKQ